MTSLAALKTCRTLQCVRSQSPQAQRLRLQSHIPARSVRSIPMERPLWGRGCWRGRGVSRFGVAFNEPSGPCLTRSGGTNEELRAAAIGIATAVGARHFFAVAMRDTFPINVLRILNMAPEVGTVFCATANPVVTARREFLRKIGYKR